MRELVLGPFGRTMQERTDHSRYAVGDPELMNSSQETAEKVFRPVCRRRKTSAWRLSTQHQYPRRTLLLCSVGIWPRSHAAKSSDSFLIDPFLYLRLQPSNSECFELCSTRKNCGIQGNNYRGWSDNLKAARRAAVSRDGPVAPACLVLT